ncbi:MAG: FmdB family zinc ribbon protein [Kiritimatiellia bacterium]
MPTYEYECRKCGHVFDIFQSITAPHLKKCPKCRGLIKRMIGSGAGLLFKGSGFYITDYRSEGYRKAAQAEKSDGKSEAKPAKAEKTSKAPAKPDKPAKAAK